MGDADVAQNIFPNDNTEVSLDEALTELDEDMYRLFAFINMLNVRLSSVMSEAASFRKLRRCFTAFNFFAVPVILAIGIVYTSAGQIIPNSIEHGLEKLIMILMYAAMCVGLPFYISYLWDMCYEGGKEEILLSSETENDDTPNELELTLDDVEESLQNIAEFQALSRAMYSPNTSTDTRSRQEIMRIDDEQEREDSKTQAADESDGFKVQTTAAYNNQGIKSAKCQIIDLDFEDCNTDTGFMLQNKLDESNLLNSIIIGNSQEYLVSKNEEVSEEKGIVKKLSRQELSGNARSRRGLRNITIQNIGDGCSVAFKKDVGCNTDETFFVDTPFGL